MTEEMIQARPPVYDFQAIEAKWRARWEEQKLYQVDLQNARHPYYNLMMFPYPSAEGLHVGNVYAFVGSDIHGRWKAMQGYDVFEPIGFDAFGIHSENFAIKKGIHPRILTALNVSRFREEQLKRIGNRFDWSHEVQTTDPGYYRWTQWIFLQLFKHGLAERKAAPVNWCPRDKTVLADEQVINGRCERCGNMVEQRWLEQWFLKITAYAQKLLDNLDQLDWSERVKTAQRNWIGRSEEEEPGTGRKIVTYHLRDWLISRQRYWGPPIPIIYCQVHGAVPVPEDQLPVLLPEIEDWAPTGTGSSPLAIIESFVNTTCPICGLPARRETDVSDNFLDSAWYYLRYPSSHDDTQPWDPALTRKWLPVDMYTAGPEHSVLHLMYTRFISMALHDLGYLDFEEPFKHLRAHGMITKDGAKMSKSRGNVINPDEYLAHLGTDVLRVYLMFMGPYEIGGDFSDRGIGGIVRFLDRTWRLVTQHAANVVAGAVQGEARRAMHLTIKRVTEDIAALKYNTALAALMEYLHTLEDQQEVRRDELQTLLLLLAPFAPFLTEELWERLGNSGSIHTARWPEADLEAIRSETMTIIVQVNGRLRDQLEVAQDLPEEEIKQLALASEKARRFIAGQPIRKVIYVPKRLVNVVTG